MKKKTWIWIGGLLVALMVVGVVGATSVYAQGQTLPALGPMGNGRGPGGGHGFGLGPAELQAAAKALNMTTDELSSQLQSGKTLADIASAQGVDLQTVMQAIQAARPPRLGQAELDAAAQALNMTSDELSSALQNGQTLQELADAAGVDIQTVQDAIKSAHVEEMRQQINQAVTDGTITQDKADWLLEGLDKGFLDGPGFGFPHGPRPNDGLFMPPAQQNGQ